MEQNPKATKVILTGPEKVPSVKKPGTDIETFKVTILTEGLNALKTYICHSFEKAATVAADIARDRGLELVDQTVPF
ncbi:MAG TPA: hypothetical protein PKH10_02065 [bacterium]|nr:hypothetical protein [bacterium]